MLKTYLYILMEYTGYGSRGYDMDAVASVSQFNQSFVGEPESGAYDNYFSSNNDHAYKNAMYEHDEGHLLLNNADTTNQHANSTKDDASAFLRGAIKKGGKLVGDETEQVTESFAQHKYSRLANSSYDYFNSRGKITEVHSGLRDAKYDYIDDLAGFQVDEELSTIDNLVLHNAETGEAHVSYRGTTDNIGRTKTFFKDWKINAEITGGSTHSSRVQQARTQMDSVISKYGKDNLSVSGHSQGGHISWQQAVEHDLPGFHFNPAINFKQLKNVEEFGDAVRKQNVYKTPLDFASPVAHNKKVGKINIVQNLKNMDGVVETHSIDQFAPKPSGFYNGMITAERRTMAGSVLKGAGAVAGVGLTAYQLGTDIKEDLKGDKSKLEKSVDIGIDSSKIAEEAVVDGEILSASLALAPETMGASLVVGLGAMVINDMIAGHVADEMKEEAPKVGKALENTGKKIGKWLRGLF
jgi:hypothetical protein